MNDVQRRFNAMHWKYAEEDPKALAELERRIAAAGRAGSTIIYSKLVDGVSFDVASLSDSPRKIDIHAWQNIDRAMLGDFLAEISRHSYERGRFLASALAVNAEGVPGDGFYALLTELGMIPMKTSSLGYFEWAKQVKLAQDFYRRHFSVIE